MRKTGPSAHYRPIETFTALLLMILVLFSLCLSGCQSTPPPSLPTNTSTTVPPSATPTVTVAWFPPTSTPSPFPTPVITPTLDVRPQIGEIVLHDDFTNPAPWQLGQTSTTSIALGEEEITLALNQPGGYLYTLRNEPLLRDFHAEITASPSLCRGEDEYGLLLRVSPSLDFYRFSLTCNGQTRLDKYFQGKASSPQPLMMSGAIPPGAPSQSRLAVWLNGKEMMFFANDEHLFTINDPSLTQGTLGLFVRSRGDNALTVSFSDLIIFESQP